MEMYPVLNQAPRHWDVLRSEGIAPYIININDEQKCDDALHYVISQSSFLILNDYIFY